MWLYFNIQYWIEYIEYIEYSINFNIFIYKNRSWVVYGPWAVCGFANVVVELKKYTIQEVINGLTMKLNTTEDYISELRLIKYPN